MWQKNKNEEFVPDVIRDTTPHLIHESKGLTVPFPVAFHEESRGFDPESIYQSYELCRFGGTRRLDPEGGRGGPRGQKMRFPKFDPIILRSSLIAIS